MKKVRFLITLIFFLGFVIPVQALDSLLHFPNDFSVTYQRGWFVDTFELKSAGISYGEYSLGASLSATFHDENKILQGTTVGTLLGFKVLDRSEAPIGKISSAGTYYHPNFEFYDADDVRVATLIKPKQNIWMLKNQAGQAIAFFHRRGNHLDVKCLSRKDLNFLMIIFSTLVVFVPI